MERLILDTGAPIALERGTLNTGDVLPDDVRVAISAVTAAELLVGVELADDARRDDRREFVDGVLDRVEVIPLDLEIARHHAQLLAHTRRTCQPRSAHGLQIAATARATGQAWRQSYFEAAACRRPAGAGCASLENRESLRRRAAAPALSSTRASARGDEAATRKGIR